MEQLERRAYSRAELEEIFRTSRLDSIKRSLERAGYGFTSAGRGNTSTITITALPKPPTAFEGFAKREFACGPQARLEDMETFFSLLLFDTEFRYFPATYQAQLLREQYDITISDQTLRNWKKKLIDLNWIAIDENDCRYYSCRRGEKPAAIDREQHRKEWREFYGRIEQGENPETVRREIYYRNNGMPRKQRGFAENAIEQDKMQELRKILKKSE